MDCRRAIVLWDFTAENEREITVHADERVIILKSESSDWWFIKSVQTEESGFIPPTYLQEGVAP
jgi:SH3 domain